MTKCFPNPLNDQWFTNLTSQINACKSQAELQALVNSAFHDLSMLFSTLTSNEGFATLLNALRSAPTDLPSVLTWITNFITFIDQWYLPYINIPTQLAAITTQVMALTTAINALAAANGWSITIPSVGVICTL